MTCSLAVSITSSGRRLIRWLCNRTGPYSSTLNPVWQPEQGESAYTTKRPRYTTEAASTRVLPQPHLTNRAQQMAGSLPQSGHSPGGEPQYPTADQTQQVHNRTLAPEETGTFEDHVSQQLDSWAEDPGGTSRSVPGNQSMRATQNQYMRATQQQPSSTMQSEQNPQGVQLNRTMKATQPLPSLSLHPQQTTPHPHMNQTASGTQRMPSMTLNPERTTHDIPQNCSMKASQQLPSQSSGAGQTSTRTQQDQSLRGTQQLPTRTMRPELTPFKTPQHHPNKIPQHLPTRTVKFDTSTFNSTGESGLTSDPFDSEQQEASNEQDSQQARFDQLCQLAEGLLQAPQQQPQSAAPMDSDTSQQAAPHDEAQYKSRDADPSYENGYASVFIAHVNPSYIEIRSCHIIMLPCHYTAVMPVQCCHVWPKWLMSMLPLRNGAMELCCHTLLLLPSEDIAT